MRRKIDIAESETKIFKMYFLIYAARPNEGTKAYRKYGGADVACWIKTGNREVARQRARKLIEERGWAVEGLEEEHSMTRELALASEGFRYYEQALIDGEVLVFVTHPAKGRRARKNRKNLAR